MKHTFLKALLLVTLVGLFASCDDAPGKAPSRKKLPQLTADQSWEGYQGLQLQQEPPGNNATTVQAMVAYNDTIVGGKPFIALSLRNQEADSMALALVNLYEPMASQAMLLLKQQGKNGAVLDLRSEHTGKPVKATYTVQNETGLAMSLLFVWDTQSVGRAVGFTTRLQQITGIRAKLQQP